jgi:ketosteroid isomerase-like protein
MAEHPDVALVRRGYQAFSNGDGQTLAEIIAEDATQYQPGSVEMSGEYKGLQAILEFYGRLANETNGSFRVELDRLYTDGKGQVVATHRATGQRSGRNLDTWASLTFTVVDGTARDSHGCQEDIAAWDDFWA